MNGFIVLFLVNGYSYTRLVIAESPEEAKIMVANDLNQYEIKFHVLAVISLPKGIYASVKQVEKEKFPAKQAQS